MEQLTIVNWNFPIYTLTKFAPTFNAKRISNFVPILHAIHFLGVRIDLRSLEQLIRSAWLANLRHLRVGHCPSIPSDTWNIPPLLRSMEVAIPKLETFEWWIYSQVPTFVTPFDTFTRLRKLKNLSIASHILARRRTFSHLHASKVMYPEAVLPKSVESLTIHNIPVNFFEIIPFVRQYLRRAKNGWSALTGLIKYVAAKFSMLKHLELTVNMERANRNQPDGIELLEFLSKTIIFIRLVAELLLKFEVRLIVLRAPGRYDRSSRTLISAGYTAPSPHSLRPWYR
jgi:hypothetical protein